MKVCFLILLVGLLVPQAIDALPKRSRAIPDCNDYEDGDTVPDRSSCSRYFLCVGGRALRKSCARGLYYDSRSGDCNRAFMVDCQINALGNIEDLMDFDGNVEIDVEIGYQAEEITTPCVTEPPPPCDEETTPTKTTTCAPATTSKTTTTKTTTTKTTTTKTTTTKTTTTKTTTTKTTTPCVTEPPPPPCDEETTPTKTTTCAPATTSKTTTTKTTTTKTTTTKTTTTKTTTTKTTTSKTTTCSTTAPPCDEPTPTPSTPPCDEATPTPSTPPCTGGTPTTTCTTTTCTTTTCSTTSTVAPINYIEPLNYLSSPRQCATLPNGTILLDANHCRRYYVCQNRRAKRTRCSGGQWFDSMSRQCLPRSQVTSCIARRN